MNTQNPKKKWTSFVELRDDLLKEGIGKLTEQTKQVDLSDSDNFLVSGVTQIIRDTETASSSDDFFNCLCRLSVLVEGLDQDKLNQLLQKTNLYVLFISAIFTNKKFSESLNTVTKEEKGIIGKDADNLHVIEKKLLNIAISLAFFPMALALSAIKKESVAFLRRHVTKLLKLNIKAINDQEISFTNLCFKLESISWNHQYHYTARFPIKLNDEFLFNTLRLVRSVVGISILSLTVNAILGEQFKIAFRKIDGSERFDLSRALNSIYGSVHRIEAGVQSYYDNAPKESIAQLKSFFDIFVWDNERNLLYFIKEITAGFEYQKGEKFYEVILDKVTTAERIKNRLKTFAKQNLSAFSTELGGEEREWANKVYIVSIKTMAALAEVDSAADSRWKFSVAVRELIQWIREMHEILNLFYLEDEFDSIAPFLKEENVTTEWKSTLLTPLEQEFINDKAELANGRNIFLRIVKSILGMLNTDGGVIIVGLVEHPERIVREEFLTFIREKNGKSFFDIGYEIERRGKNLDQIRLQILDNLKSITKVSEEKFNGLFSLEPILIRTNDKTVTIVKISVQKIASPVLNVKEEQGTTWVSLTKRAEGKTINVDVRDYIKI